METNETTEANREYLMILFDCASTRVLVRESSDRYYFPAIGCDEVPHLGSKMVAAFSAELKTLFGESFDLAFLYATINETYHRHIPPSYIALFELRKPLVLDDDWFFWLDICKPLTRTFGNLGAEKYARRVFEECSEYGVRPWEKPGWFGIASSWGVTTLASLGYTVRSAFEQHWVSPSSTVLKADTDRGVVYLKASNKREGTVTDCISDLGPDLVRKPLHIDEEGERMLMEDYGPTLEGGFTLQDFERVKQLMGGLQQRSSKYLKTLLERGVPKVDISEIVHKVEVVMKDALLYGNGCPDSHCTKDLGSSLQMFDEAAVEAAIQNVRDFLKHLYESHGIPLALKHGDVHGGNVIRSGCGKDDYVIFDWGSASLDLPFTDLDPLITFIEPNEDRLRASLDSYLQHWTQYASLEAIYALRRRLQVKDTMVRVVRHYEYAKEKDLRPYLEDNDVATLRSILREIHEDITKSDCKVAKT